MACWLTAPSPYLDQCWLTNVLWHSSEGIIEDQKMPISQTTLKIFICKIACMQISQGPMSWNIDRGRVCLCGVLWDAIVARASPSSPIVHHGWQDTITRGCMGLRLSPRSSPHCAVGFVWQMGRSWSGPLCAKTGGFTTKTGSPNIKTGSRAMAGRWLTLMCHSILRTFVSHFVWWCLLNANVLEIVHNQEMAKKIYIAVSWYSSCCWPGTL